MELEDPQISILGDDPPRNHRINANSFQQHALLTFQSYQYAVYYTSASIRNSTKPTSCFVNLSRRQIGSSLANESWETIIFDDYEQTVDDGHNTISLGVCPGDGTIHLSYDHHCDELRFRISIPELATKPEIHPWSKASFGGTQNTLPGLQHISQMNEVTYPRFVSANDDLLLSHRIGQAGLGSDVLYHYSSKTHKYSFIGTPLTGAENNPYINGIDFAKNRLHLSWCYRGFVEYEGVHDPNNKSHKTQAGPNGPENNYGLFYAWSDDLGRSWNTSGGNKVAILGGNSSNEETGVLDTIVPNTDGIMVFDIPKHSGILNQESQVADIFGGFHVLNREIIEGSERWVIYSRHHQGSWSRVIIKFLSPTETGSRGSICANSKGQVFCVLPGNIDNSLTLVKLDYHQDGPVFTLVWSGEGFDGEPLIDIKRLETSDVLSIFTRAITSVKDTKDIVVLDFNLREA